MKYIDFLAIPVMPQRQDSTTDQIKDLVKVATRLGMYDAADWLLNSLRSGDSVIDRICKEKT